MSLLSSCGHLLESVGLSRLLNSGRAFKEQVELWGVREHLSKGPFEVFVPCLLIPYFERCQSSLAASDWTHGNWLVDLILWHPVLNPGFKVHELL